VKKSDSVDLPGFGKIGLVAAQLWLLVLIIQKIEVQDVSFQKFSVMVLVAFLVHALLPLRFRLHFFALFSLATILILFGVTNGAWIIGLGLLLIGLCYLPLKFAVRVGLILAVALVLTAMRAEWIPSPWSMAVWPIIGAMFMFRLIIYLYDIHHEKQRPNFARALSYFFMAPNTCFLLFPVIDYKKFQRTYYNEDAYLIYQRGISWIIRGLVHIILYRMVYNNLTIDPTKVEGLAQILQFSFVSFLLYLQVSGTFHMIVGILLLFGFNLPETNNLYFMASSFTDFWRRINIYWKDFMMKVFYYPIYFKVRKIGETKAIIISTLVVFFAAWSLHAYQWFWLRGSLLLEWHDGLYWLIMGLLLIANSLYERKHGRERSLGKQSRTILDYLAVGCGTAGTFLTMGLLWGMWSSDSFSQWLYMWGSAGNGWIMMLILVLALFAASILLGRAAKRMKWQGPAIRLPSLRPVGFAATALVGVISAAALYGLMHVQVYSKLPGKLPKLVEVVRFPQLNKVDREQMQRGYYVDLIHVHRHNTELWQLVGNEPKDWRGFTPEDWLETGDFRGDEFQPNMTVNHKGVDMTTNRWGMRDKDYELQKDPGAYRIALMGSSYSMAGGVQGSETFEAVLEERMNQQPGDHPFYEILNFALPGRTVERQVTILENKVLDFEPDAVIYVAHSSEGWRAVDKLVEHVRSAKPIPYPGLASILEQAKASDRLEPYELRKRLRKFSDEIVSWAYRRIVTRCREEGIRPLLVFLPLSYQRLEQKDIVNDLAAAEEAGFTVISLREVYDGYDTKDIQLANWDTHPNIQGNQLIADGLFQVFSTRADELFRSSDNDPAAESAQVDQLN